MLANDFSEVKRKFFASTSNPGTGPGAYSVFHEVNGSGSILANDFSAVKSRFFNTLPSPEPAGSDLSKLGPTARRLRPRLTDGLFA